MCQQGGASGAHRGRWCHIHRQGQLTSELGPCGTLWGGARRVVFRAQRVVGSWEQVVQCAGRVGWGKQLALECPLDGLLLLLLVIGMWLLAERVVSPMCNATHLVVFKR